MTLLEVIAIPLVIAVVIFLVLLPLLGPRMAWDYAGSGAIGLFVISATVAYLRTRFFHRPPKCFCGDHSLAVSRVSREGDWLKCPVCDAEFHSLSYGEDGWKRCFRIVTDQQEVPWKRRRRWGPWIDE